MKLLVKKKICEEIDLELIDVIETVRGHLKS